MFSRRIDSNNYLSNSYFHLTKLKAFHFLFLLIEFIIMTFYELETYLKGFNSENMSKNNNNLNIISKLAYKLEIIYPITKLIILLLLTFFTDIFYFFIVLKKFKVYHVTVTIMFDSMEIICFRSIAIIYYILFFSLRGIYFIITCILVIPHIYLIMNDFLYNHLYYIVPNFIEYPYDEFSSLYDIVLIINKLLISISGTTTLSTLGKFCYLLMMVEKIFFSFYFITKLKNHSYLFMINSFLNRTRLCLYFTNSIIIILALLFGKNEIVTILFLIISIIVFLISVIYIYFIYNPYLYINVKRETPMENLFFYLFILSEKNDYDFVIENKIKEHYDLCGICSLCKKSRQYFNRYKNKKNIENDEKEKLINEENNNNRENNKNKLIDLFDIIYDNETKYFELIKNIIINYKYKGKESLNNNSFYYINLSFLIYSDYEKHNITLSLNERLILEVLNKENRSFLDNHESQISQLLLCNDFINLSNKILNQFKEIINSEADFNKAKKIVDLSVLLKEMKNKKYKENLFSHKMENISNSKHLILICSIVYEEIFNTTLNNSQFPIRENIQTFEDTFHSNSNKINKIISLSVDLTNKNCKIIRAGKGLYSYINNNLFDLFPLIFKQYQINLFMSKILENFEVNEDKEKINNDKNIKIINKGAKVSLKNLKGLLKNNNNKNKKDIIEIKLILADNYSSKMYYQLLSLKLSSLFSNNAHNFIIFDGIYIIHKYTFITLQDFEENKNPKEILIGVSEPNLEQNNKAYSLSFKKYISLLNSQGFSESIVSTFNLTFKLFNIYILNKKENGSISKLADRKSGQIKGTRFDYDEDEATNKNTKVDNIQLIEDNASVSSAQTGSSYSGGINNIGIRNKKKDNIYDYGGFNKIKKINFLAILIAIIILIIEYFYLKVLENNALNNNTILILYRDFTKYYFQLFSSLLGVSCINNNINNDCIRLTDIFTEEYFKNNKEEYFNFTLFIIIENELLAKDIMKKRNYFVDIHKFLGNEKYNQLFGDEIEYLRISQSITKDKINYNLSKVTMQFSEAILIVCNSFQVLASGSYNSITLLDKPNNPLSNINTQEINSLTDYQKEIYEMILNYKVFYDKFYEINDEISLIIESKSNSLKIFVYFYITFDAMMLIIIGTLMLAYTYFFDFILVKIINYINMTLNIKNDDFSFSETFNKKIENLETILLLYKVDPTKCIQNLNNIYNNYQQYLNAKNKNNSNEMNKKNYKKIMNENEKNELDNIPKNQRIISVKEVKSLGLTFIYVFMYYVNLFFVLFFYVLLLLLWIKYFNLKNNLFYLMSKNRLIESSTYRVINAYDLMVFNNLTIEEVTEMILPENKNENNVLFKSFYDDLKYIFDNKKEKNYVGKLFIDFEDIAEFTCENLFNYNRYILDLVENNTKAIELKNITFNLISLCEYIKITESKDYRTVFERHFQYIRNGILSINDFSYNGLIDHINTNGMLSKITLFFDLIVSIIIEVTNIKPHKEAIHSIINRLKNLNIDSEIIFLLYDLIAILFVTLFYIPGVNKLCNQIFILRKTFKITEMQE